MIPCGLFTHVLSLWWNHALGQDGVVYTAEEHILHGTVRGAVLEACEDLGTWQWSGEGCCTC